jgi:hypothetical protein
MLCRAGGGKISIAAEKISYTEAKREARQDELNELSNRDFVKISVCDQGKGLSQIFSMASQNHFSLQKMWALALV